MKSIDEMTYTEMIAEAKRVRIESESTKSTSRAKDLYRYWKRLIKEINDYKMFQNERS